LWLAHAATAQGATHKPKKSSIQVGARVHVSKGKFLQIDELLVY
jgi:hypothetical protein